MKALLLKTRQNLHIILLFALIAVFYLSFGCPVRLLTGVSCPGCGMTRALFALLKLDFSLAFEMHPLVLLLIVYIIRMTALAMDAQGYQTNIQMIGPSAGVLTVAKNREGFSNIIGLGLECRVNFSAINGQLTVNIDSEWTNKIIAIAVGWFICFIPIITGIVGTVSQITLPDKIFNAVNMSSSAAQNGGTYNQM